MKKRLLFTILIIVGFIGSFLLANHFADKKIGIPTHIAQSMRWFESLFLDDSELELATTKSPENKTVELKPSVRLVNAAEQNYSHREVGNRHVCIDTSLGELKYKKFGDLYTWTDQKDIYHVSDKPPEEDQFDLFIYAGKKVLDYFSLNLNTDGLPYDFNQKLTVKLNNLFELYGKLLDRSSLKKVDIKLRIYQSNTAFEKIKKQYNISSTDKINGFYNYDNNQAYLLFTNNELTMRTAVHEATHAINRAIIGYTPRWLNEGLAEYSEYIQMLGKSAVVYPNEGWTNKYFISEPLLPLSTLFNANVGQWNSGLRQQLYATSWAFVYFMMEHPQRKSILVKLIKKEQKNLCNAINKDKIEQQLEVSLNLLQTQFLSWSTSKLRRQLI